MSIRTMLYGYTVQNGRKTVIPEQAEIVTEVFERYLAGETLKQIADSLTLREVIYNGDSCLWNKNIISRMIADTRYHGNEQYPTIVSLTLFEQVAEIREKKSTKKAELSPINKLIKSKLFCERCGHTLGRVNKWRSKEKWLCSCGCDFGVYIKTLEFVAKALKQRMPSISLAAPTGMASKRMAASTGREARTIHKLFDIRYDVMRGADDVKPIISDVVILDEVSMLDIDIHYCALFYPHNTINYLSKG